ncbi:MAG: hypothetical protein ACRDSR_09930 [Pseudonocardiaceae bacterium]
MSGGGWGLVVAVVLGLVISEFSELSPWLAQKLIHWAARVRYPTRVEELSALIAERPGRLFKLVTASVFACAALTYRVTHRKTVPVHSVTSRFWIRFGSALAAGALLIGEYQLAFAIFDHVNGHSGASMGLFYIISAGTIAAFATAAEFLVPSRLPAGWATAVVSSALFLTYDVVTMPYSEVNVEFLITAGGIAGVAGAAPLMRSGWETGCDSRSWQHRRPFWGSASSPTA